MRAYIDAMRTMLRHPTLDAAFKELVLTLPAETYIAEQLDVVDPQRIHAVREAMREQLAQALYADWQWAYEAHRESGAYQPDPVSSRPPRAGGPGAHAPVPGGARAAATRCGPARPAALQGRGQHDRPLQRAGGAGDQPATSWPRRRLQRFHAMFKDEALVLDKWFALQAGAPDRGGNVLPVGQAADEPSGLQHPQPEPRPQRDLQLLQREPRRLPPAAMRRATCSGASA